MSFSYYSDRAECIRVRSIHGAGLNIDTTGDGRGSFSLAIKADIRQKHVRENAARTPSKESIAKTSSLKGRFLVKSL